MEPNADSFTIPTPPDWSLNLGATGRGLVIGAVVLYALAILSWLFAPRIPRLARVGTWAFQLGNAAVLGTFGCLAVLFLQNRFEYSYVWEHSDTRNPAIYRIAGIWSGQQGSFLLWATCAAIFGLFTVGGAGIYKRWYVIAYSTFLGMIAGILAFESPFNLNLIEGKPFVPNDGFGLAPSLQNYWVTIHPPTIFLGFGSLTALFALSVAALAERNYNSWIPIVRPMAIISTTLVGLGLCMGGFWAYETLGWGGFWMWDPVENVSFVPWCFSIALIHGVVVQATRGKWKLTNLLLAALPFLFFLYGTFLTRSGFLSDASVHSFAEMDNKALKLLIGVMGISIIGFLGLWMRRVWQERADTQIGSQPLTRDRWMSYGIWFVSLIGLATFVGMSVPLIQALRGQKPSVVQEGVYHQVLPYLFIPLMLLMGIAPFLSWKKTDPKKLWSRAYSVLCVSIGITGVLLFAAVMTRYSAQIDITPEVTLFGNRKVNGLTWIMFLVIVCIIPVVANVWHAVERWRGSKLGTSAFLAHIGLATLMCGLIVSRGFERKEDGMLMKDHPASVMGYAMSYSGMTLNDKDRDNKVLIDVKDSSGKTLFTARPGMYKATMGDGQESVMVWPHIERGWLQDTYISLGQPQTSGTQEVPVKVGETVNFGNVQIKYLGLQVNGEFGMPGTTFGARVLVTKEGKTKQLEPRVELQGQGGVREIPVPLEPGLNLAMAGMDAADKSVRLRVDFTDPIFPIEVFHKPLTILVFFGTLLMTLAGVMAAWYRRPKYALPVWDASPSETGTSDAPERELAPVGANQ